MVCHVANFMLVLASLCVHDPVRTASGTSSKPSSSSEGVAKSSVPVIAGFLLRQIVRQVTSDYIPEGQKQSASHHNPLQPMEHSFHPILSLCAGSQASPNLLVRTSIEA